ncbi:MAG: acetate uptake transporter [Desulfuromonadales bacterium]|nr:acetate uptake transporter [Desulfuromonadales bacterium]
MQEIPSATERFSCALPPLGLLALAPTIILYTLTQAELLQISPSLLGLMLILGGSTQFSAGLTARQQGNISGSATLIPLGLFWLSLLGLKIFPDLRLGSSPSPAAITAYLSMWGLFAAILYLGSFRQSRIVQMLFGTLMACLLSLGMAEIRGNIVFFYTAAAAGGACGMAAFYIGVAQLLNSHMKRRIMPLGSWQAKLD